MQRRQASSFYPHFEHEERPTIDKFVGLFNQLIFKEKPILTDFLDPGKREILKTIVGNDAITQEYGGYKLAEKKRMYLSLDWENLQIKDYKVVPIEINYPIKFTKLTHSSILGTLANSGVETETFGDIITDGNGKWQFFVKEELKNFFLEQVDRIGRTQVRLKEISFKDVIVPEDTSQEKTEIIASLRVDSVLAGISKQSRTQIKKVIENKQAKLNWHDIQDSNIIVKVGDILSLRHFGRVEIMDITGTKKGKYKVVLKLWRTRN